MTKVKVEVCSICKKEDCSGKEYDAIYYKDIGGQLSDCNFNGYTFDKSRIKTLRKRVCESQTGFRIRSNIFSEAGNLFEKIHGPTRSVFVCNYKSLKEVLKKHKLKLVPRIRVHWIECGVFAKTLPVNGEIENLDVPLSHYKSAYGIIHNNEEKINAKN